MATMTTRSDHLHGGANKARVVARTGKVKADISIWWLSIDADPWSRRSGSRSGQAEFVRPISVREMMKAIAKTDCVTAWEAAFEKGVYHTACRDGVMCLNHSWNALHWLAESA